MQGTPTVMVNGEILDQKEVPYFQPGALKTYIDTLAGVATSARRLQPLADAALATAPGRESGGRCFAPCATAAILEGARSVTRGRIAGMAQLVAHPTCNRAVAGSSPAASSLLARPGGPVHPAAPPTLRTAPGGDTPPNPGRSVGPAGVSRSHVVRSLTPAGVC